MRPQCLLDDAEHLAGDGIGTIWDRGVAPSQKEACAQAAEADRKAEALSQQR
jgi:hypothetical protein